MSTATTPSRITPSSFAFGLVGLTFFLMVFGSTVRVHGAGLACPDWPLCFGEVVPAYEFKVYLEFGHRVVAGFVSLGFVGLFGWTWRNGMLGRVRGLGMWFALAALALCTQVVLGGLTVLELLAEWTVASHLVTGNTFCCLLLMIALTLREAEAPRTRTETTHVARAVALMAMVLVPMQVVMGGLVSASEAGLACGTWPGCNGDVWFPTFSGLVGLQVMHRIMAYTVAAVLLVNAFVQRGEGRITARLTGGLVCVQVALGVANVMLQLPAEVTLLHSAGADALMLCSAWTLRAVFDAPLAAAPKASHLGVPVEAK